MLWKLSYNYKPLTWTEAGFLSSLEEVTPSGPTTRTLHNLQKKLQFVIFTSVFYRRNKWQKIPLHGVMLAVTLLSCRAHSTLLLIGLHPLFWYDESLDRIVIQYFFQWERIRLATDCSTARHLLPLDKKQSITLTEISFYGPDISQSTTSGREICWTATCLFQNSLLCPYIPGCPR